MEREQLIPLLLDTEKNRANARIDTGSLLMEDALRLHDFVAAHPDIHRAVEWGTYLGRSALAIATAMNNGILYTCDAENDAMPHNHHTLPGAIIVLNPFTPSTRMLQALAPINPAIFDLFFFDGFIMADDPELIMQLSHARTIYAFDDYKHNMKGTKNVAVMTPLLEQTHTFTKPERGSGLAYFTPKG